MLEQEDDWFMYTSEEQKIARFLVDDFGHMDRKEQMDKFLKLVHHLQPMLLVALSVAIDMTIREKESSPTPCKITTSNTNEALQAGWGKSPASRKWHFFPANDTFSLCRKVGFFASNERLDSDHENENNCAECKKRHLALSEQQ